MPKKKVAKKVKDEFDVGALEREIISNYEKWDKKLKPKDLGYKGPWVPTHILEKGGVETPVMAMRGFHHTLASHFLWRLAEWHTNKPATDKPLFIIVFNDLEMRHPSGMYVKMPEYVWSIRRA